MTQTNGTTVTTFDFVQHENAAVSAYLRVRPFYEDLASVVARIIEECLAKRNINVHSVQSRAKDPVSLGRKAAIPSEGDPSTPKYSNPLDDITDLAGVRIITNMRDVINEVDRLLYQEFDIVERSDKGKTLIDEDRFGYQSVHYLVKISGGRSVLAEYEKYSNGIVEVQVRTILQHAWAEIEHDIQYKSSYSIPIEIRRRFMALAGMLEVADREFQAIQDADKILSDEAQSNVKAGLLSEVEITPKALKSFLNKRLGPDGRMSAYSYEWTTKLLKRLGFSDLEQVEQAIKQYDDDKISRVAEGGRQGQIARFEHMLLASLGDKFIQRHPWGDQSWFSERRLRFIKKFESKGIPVAIYDPLKL